jgi:pyruvate,water dikinase
VLECLPLVVPSPQVAAPRPRTFKQYPVLLDQGVVACRGVGAGPVVMVREDQDLQDFPQGGVLVARQTSPRFASIMPRAAAIVTDAGSPTGHTALLAREYQVPTILNTAVATQVLKPGQLVTVDANYNNIYEGLIPELLPPRESRRDDLAENPLFQALRAVVQKVVPLNLLNPEDESFTPEGCRTLHDIVRYAHESSLREMFKLTENETRYQAGAVQLDTGLPLMVLLLDLGGGLHRGWGLKVRPQQILSRPFQAFWQGLTAGSWPQGGGARPPQSYALLSANYMNFRLHLGALLTTVEAYISEEFNDNYLTFRVQGDDSMPTGRGEPVRRLAAILARQGFACHRRGDLLEARFAKHSPPDTAQSLVWLGQLLGSARLWEPAGFAEESGEALINDAGVN